MNEELFRKKSLDKVKSPENLDDYIRVANPGVWLLLVCIIVLLVGACVWGIFGKVNSTVETSVHVENGVAICTVEDNTAVSIQKGMTVEFAGYEAVISEIHDLDMTAIRCSLQSEQQIPDGIYEGKIITERIKPISFILN